MQQDTPSSRRLIGSMTLAGALSGLVLVAVYLGTGPRIRHNRAVALERAVLNVLPGSTSFETWAQHGDQLVKVDQAPGTPSQGLTVYRGIFLNTSIRICA